MSDRTGLIVVRLQGWLKRGFLIIPWILLMVSLGAAPGWADPAGPDQVLTAAINPVQLFQVHCVGCHPNGGNIIRRGKTLKAKALQRYGYNDAADIAAIITQGKGIMSAYKDRLTPAEIAALASYVQTQAKTDWK